MKRILVCGGRDYGLINPKRPLEYPRKHAERRRLNEVLSTFAVKLGTFQIIHGGAKGADALAGAWASDRPAFPEPLAFPADWDNVSVPGAVVRTSKKTGKPYNILAGHFRNQRMIDEGKPDLVIAFPGGTGTADMVDRARKAGIEVREVV